MASEISFPWEMFMQAEQAKNQNRRNMYQDIAGLGQGLGEGFNTIGQSMQEEKKKQLLQQIVQAMQQKGQPIPGPQGYTPPGSTGTAPAGQPIDNSNQINALMMQYDPKTMMERMPTALQQSEIEKNNAMTKRYGQMGLPGSSGEKVTVYENPDGSVSLAPTDGGVPLRVSPASALQYTGVSKSKKTMPQSPIASIRGKQFLMSDLPSRSNPNTAAGAAYQVKVASRQGKAIIGKPGSPQQIALAASDLARAVQRSAPQLETLQGASFSNNVVTRVNQLTQQITANPSGTDVPKIRKQIYDLLDDLDKTAQPWIDNQVKNVEGIWGESLPPNWNAIKSRELGNNIPDVKFVDESGGQGWSDNKESRYQELLRKRQSGTH